MVPSDYVVLLNNVNPFIAYHYLTWCKYINIAPQTYNVMQKINIYKYDYQCVIFYSCCVWVQFLIPASSTLQNADYLLLK